jgi:transcriptional regulator with XRE-family HTH domain
MRNLGEQIKAKRVAMGLTQIQLAEEANISVGFLSDIETGKKYPSLKKREALARALNCVLVDSLEDKLPQLKEPLVERQAVEIIQKNGFIRDLVLMMGEMSPNDIADAARFVAEKKELTELRKAKGA